MTIRLRGLVPLIALLVGVVATLAPMGASARTAVTGTRVGIHPDGVTRFVMDLSAALDFKVTTHVDPMRVVINTDGVAWMTDAALPKPVGSVARLRYEENFQGGRIVLVLDKPAEVKAAFLIPPRDGLGWRFAMDLRETTRAAFSASATAEPAARPAPKGDVQASVPDLAPPSRERAPIVVVSPAVAAAPRPASVSTPSPVERPATGGAVLSAAMPPPPERPAPIPAAVFNAPTSAPALAPIAAPEPAPSEPAALVTKVSATLPAPDPMPEPKGKSDDGRPVIVLDPGHGGVDPGAIGVSGAYEKNITLAMAREVKAQLEKTGRYKVHLTRDRDVFIRLRDRIAIARQHGADLFVSLHADAVQNPQIRGLSVYTLSQNASDSEAQALAEKENKADLIAGIDLSHESADVANILIDLAQRETMNRSAVFAGGLVDEMGRSTPLLGNTHRFAGFAVLKAPDVPSVLVELGYLSHKDEERQLRQADYRQKLAKSVVRSVDAFFLQGQKARRP